MNAPSLPAAAMMSFEVFLVFIVWFLSGLFLYAPAGASFLFATQRITLAAEKRLSGWQHWRILVGELYLKGFLFVVVLYLCGSLVESFGIAALIGNSIGGTVFGQLVAVYSAAEMFDLSRSEAVRLSFAMLLYDLIFVAACVLVGFTVLVLAG